MAVAAGFERNVLSMALGAFINNQTVSFCPAFHDGGNNPWLGEMHLVRPQ